MFSYCIVSPGCSQIVTGADQRWVETLQWVDVSLHQRHSWLIGPNCVIHLQIWQGVPSARQQFRLIDCTLCAGEKYFIAEMIFCWCAFTRCSWASSFFLLHLSFFFFLSSEGPKTLKLELSDAQGPGRSLFEPVCCLRICRVVSCLSHSPLCVSTLSVLGVFFHVLSDYRSMFDTMWSLLHHLLLRNLLFFTSVELEQSRKWHQVEIVLLILVDADSSKLLLRYWGLNYLDLCGWSFCEQWPIRF